MALNKVSVQTFEGESFLVSLSVKIWDLILYLFFSRDSDKGEETVNIFL